MGAVMVGRMFVTIGAYDNALHGILQWLEGLEEFVGHIWAGEEGEGCGEGHVDDDNMGRHPVLIHVAQG